MSATARRATPRRRTCSTPSLRHERGLLRAGRVLVAGMDEVGRGALAGPVSVGVVVVSAETRSAPAGVKDSKLVPPPRREALVPRVQRWAHAYGVGHAGPDEIDDFGILAALRLAGMRALTACGVVPDLVLLDGKHDWLSAPAARVDQDALFDLEPRPRPNWPDVVVPPVITRIKADMTCSSVAGASILAKVERDTAMVALAEQTPEYGWAVNKGYAAPDHRAALLRHGPCLHHRRSWNLLGGVGEAGAPDQVPVETGDVAGSEMHDDEPVKVRLT